MPEVTFSNPNNETWQFAGSFVTAMRTAHGITYVTFYELDIDDQAASEAHGAQELDKKFVVKHRLAMSNGLAKELASILSRSGPQNISVPERDTDKN